MPHNYQWGEGVRKSLSDRHFFLRDYIKSRAETGTHAQVNCGQLWLMATERPLITLSLNKDRSTFCHGTLNGEGYWSPEQEPPLGPQLLKLIYKPAKPKTGRPARIKKCRLRPGVLLSKPYSEQKRGKFLWNLQRAIFVQGWSEPCSVEVHGDLTVDYRGTLDTKYESEDRDEGEEDEKDSGSYRVWKAWGINARFSMIADDLGRRGCELLKQLGDMCACQALQGHEPAEKTEPLSAARRLLAELLGCRQPIPSTPWKNGPRLPVQTLPPMRIAPPPRRGELVKVRFSPGEEPVPCIVVSPDEFNDRLDLDTVLVVQCVRHLPIHGQSSRTAGSPALPLGANGRDGDRVGVKDSWSVYFPGLRSIFPVQDGAAVEVFSPRIKLSDDNQWFTIFEERLSHFYA